MSNLSFKVDVEFPDQWHPSRTPTEHDLYRTLCADCVPDLEPKVFPWPRKQGRLLQMIDSRMLARF
jgi:hypothetical protein